MSAQDAARRSDPLPLVAAILAAVGAGLSLAAVWTTIYTASGGGSATPYGLRNNDVFSGLVRVSWVLLIIGVGLALVAMVPLLVATSRRGHGRPIIAVAMVPLIGATALIAIAVIGFLSKGDVGPVLDLSLSVAFYLALGGAIACVIATVLTLVAVAVPASVVASRAPVAVPANDASATASPRAAASAWPESPAREPLLSSPPPPARIASPYPTAADQALTRAMATDDGVTRPLEVGGVPCRSCGALVGDGVKFCSACGTEQAPAAVPSCGSCGAVGAVGDRFCRVCGDAIRTA